MTLIAGDIVLKEGCKNDYFYYLQEGLVEVFQQKSDFEFYDSNKVTQYALNTSNYT